MMIKLFKKQTVSFLGVKRDTLNAIILLQQKKSKYNTIKNENQDKYRENDWQMATKNFKKLFKWWPFFGLNEK